MIYLKYLRYVIRHKWFVMVECFRYGLYWRGLMHDLSKFRPSEFIPYARYFYGEWPTWEEAKKLPYYSYHGTKEGVSSAFDFAWLLHQKRNDHHWQWWILPEDDGGTKLIPMSDGAGLEMYCDWIGAGMAISGRKDPCPWYEANKGKMQLHPATKAKLEQSIYGGEVVESIDPPVVEMELP